MPDVSHQLLILELQFGNCPVRPAEAGACLDASSFLSALKAAGPGFRLPAAPGVTTVVSFCDA